MSRTNNIQIEPLILVCPCCGGQVTIKFNENGSATLCDPAEIYHPTDEQLAGTGVIFGGKEEKRSERD